MSRMIIPVSFTDREDYEFVRDLPNSSHYLRELVKKDRKNKENDKKYVDLKIEELKKYIDSIKFEEVKDDNKDDSEMKNKIKNIIGGL